MLLSEPQGFSTPMPVDMGYVVQVMAASDVELVVSSQPDGQGPLVSSGGQSLPVSSLPDAQAAASDDSSDESARKTRRKAVVERSDESAMLTDDAALFFFSLLMFSTLVLTPFRLGKDFGLELSASERMAGAARSSAVRCRECATSRRRDVPVRPCLWRRGARRRERLQCTCRLTKTHDDRRRFKRLECVQHKVEHK